MVTFQQNNVNNENNVTRFLIFVEKFNKSVETISVIGIGLRSGKLLEEI